MRTLFVAISDSECYAEYSNRVIKTDNSFIFSLLGGTAGMSVFPLSVGNFASINQIYHQEAHL